jgi:hypothetical protein
LGSNPRSARVGQRSTPDYQPAAIGPAARDGNEYILLVGGLEVLGDQSGAVVEVDLAGRIAARV